MQDRKYTLFIDESGKPDLDDLTYKNFILTGIAIPKSDLLSIETYLSFIKQKYKLPNKPLHSYDLFENPFAKVKLSSSQAREFVISLSEFISLIPIDIFLCNTNKKSFIDKYQVMGDDLKGSKENKEKSFWRLTIQQVKYL